MPKASTALGPDSVEIVAAALAKCHDLMATDTKFRDSVNAYDRELTRILMRLAMSGQRDDSVMAADAVKRLVRMVG